MMPRLTILQQLQGYNKSTLSSDVIAACVVTIMLIPQSLAYAMLAGVPPEVGLYASILPLLGYALFGSCKTLAVGPVALASLMTASALGNIAEQGTLSYLQGAITLAILSGMFLFLMGLFKCGFLSHFLSHPVVSGFITASGMVIALSQCKHILGVEAQGHNFIAMSQSLWAAIPASNLYTLAVGLASLCFLLWVRSGATRFLSALGCSSHTAALLSKTAPIIAVLLTSLAVYLFALDARQVAIVGEIPVGLPVIALPDLSLHVLKPLLLPAILIAIIGYVESVSVGKTLSAKRGERIDGDQELIGLGTANILSGLSGAFPVTGGFARSVVNFDAGAKTQVASILTAVGIAIAAWLLTPFLYYLPKAMLAATIIVAVLALIDFSIFTKAWAYSKSDFFAVLTTVAVTLLWGVETGVACGIIVSILLLLYNTSKPHVAEVGLVEGTEHFRNVLHYKVKTHPAVVSLRVDESLLFSNASYLDGYINDLVYQRGQVSDIILQCSAINRIDFSALESLQAINQRLIDQGIRLHLSEIKIPVQKLLEKSDLLTHLSGNVYFTQFDAFTALSGAKT